jgi:DNA-binding SARP family transcriptional activator/predicted ATPase
VQSLRIQLLGDFYIQHGENTVASVNQPRVQSLLAYLLLHRHAPQSRQHLAFCFWPDSPEAQALTNLRKQLLLLRRSLPESDRFIMADAKIVQWNANTPFTLDVAEFEHIISRSASLTSDQAISALYEAIDLYQGDLLPGCYDEWIAPKREELRARYIQTLTRLVLLLEDHRDYPAAIEVAQRLSRHDPLHEATYRRLMRLYILSGDRAAALNVYHTCVTILQNELGVEPDLDTRAAYDRLLKKEIPAVLRKQAPAPLASQSPIVGRRSEWQVLQEVWRAVMRGHPQFVLISGEAGIGKTRLAEEVVEWATRQGIVTAWARAYAAEGSLSYAPVIEWLRTPKLNSALANLEVSWLTELARLMPEILTKFPGLPLPGSVTESGQRHRLFESLARATLADTQQLILVLDNLQWCDLETLEWLHFLLRFDPAAKLLIIGTVRSDEIGPRHPLIGLRFGLQTNHLLAELKLAPLNSADTAQLAAQVAGGELNPDQAERIFRDTEGNPLFVVEMGRAVLQGENGDEGMYGGVEHDASPSHWVLSLPPIVQAVIEARLNRLSPTARKLADFAAAIGRNFNFDVVVQASDSTEDEVINGLDELCQRAIVREQGATVYDFSHDKIREVAYAQLSATRRRLLHRRVAQALESVHASSLDQVSGQLAVHYETAGSADLAVTYYQKAAHTALRVYASHEAVEHFSRGLALLSNLADCVEKNRQELALLLGLGPALIANRGYGFSQVREAYTRAQALTQQLGDPANPAILRALALYRIVHRQYAVSEALGEEILRLAHQAPGLVDSILYVEGHYVVGVSAFWRGEFLRAKKHLEQAVTVYNVQHHEAHTALYTQDPGAVCLVRLALVLWHLGFPDQAQQRCAEAIALARNLGHPFTLAYVLVFAAWLHNDLRDSAGTAMFAHEAAEHSRKHELQYWLPMALVLQGCLLAGDGEIEQGIERIRLGMSTYQAMQLDLYRPYSLAMLAQVHAQAGDVEQGLAALDEALATVDHHGDRFYEAELYRLRGELLGALGSPASAVEACFAQACDIARRQQAKSLELRAAVSLSHLWNHQGKHEQAYQLLAGTYGWFTEGFDTPDLQAAKALLDELC